MLQGKREHEDVLKENAALKLKAHALEMQCERLQEESEGLHRGATSEKSPSLSCKTSYARSQLRKSGLEP